jgi:HAD superfamily hydrolase (TIGR01509 family)
MAKTEGKIRGVVFDLDGTLVDSLAMTLAAFNHGITSLGGREHTPAEIMAHFGVGEGEIFAKILGREHAARAAALSREFTDRNLGQAPIFAGMLEILDALRAAKAPVAIFTGRSWETTELILTHHGLHDRFVTVVCHDHVASSKPSPEGLLLCCQRMGLAPAEVAMVGDSHMDMIAARRAGAHAIAAHWDLLAQRDLLLQERPHSLAGSPAELRANLVQLGLFNLTK